MDEATDRSNWSSVAQEAFEAELNRLIALKDAKTMDEVVERLRASKQEYARGEYNEGWECGVKWAKEVAEYPEIRRAGLTEDEVPDTVESPATCLRDMLFADDAYDPDVPDLEEFLEVAFGVHARTLHEPSPHACNGFIAGVKSVWDEVKDKL